MAGSGVRVGYGNLDNLEPSDKHSSQLRQREQVYVEFDQRKSWKVFMLPDSKVTKEDAANRTSLANSRSEEAKISDYEVNERAIWATNRKYWENRCESRLKISSIREFLCQRILPPRLLEQAYSVSRPSSRKDKRQRIFPPTGKLVVWTEFDESVAKFESEDDPSRVFNDPWLHSVYARAPLGSETEEQTWLKSNVLQLLNEAGLLTLRHASPSTHTVGRPDLCLYAGNGEEERVVICIEAKSTHNLWLPSNASEIVDNYEECWMNLDLNHCIAHPIGQVARAMIVNNAMQGVITSATRTHFLRFNVVDGDPYLLVSRRWYVGEKYYLQAWATFYKSAVEQVKREFSNELFSSWKSGSPRKGQYRESARVTKKKAQGCSKIFSLRIEYEDIRFTGGILGNGRNGFVREAVWKDKTVAVKSFDLDHGAGSSFERELEAYVELMDVEGCQLVPRLHFWAEHWTGSLLVLGLQLGTNLPFAFDDRNCHMEKETVLKYLYNLGYAHSDSDSFRNFTYVPDGNGDYLMVALDLESLEPCHSSSPVSQSSDHDHFQT